MYRMLEEELNWARDDVSQSLRPPNECLLTLAQNKPFHFSHLLFVSQTYRLSPEEAAELEVRASRNKRQKAAPTPKQNDLIPVHPEDAEIAKVCGEPATLRILASTLA